MKKRALFLLGGLLLASLSIRSYAQGCPSSLFTTVRNFSAGSPQWDAFDSVFLVHIPVSLKQAGISVFLKNVQLITLHCNAK